METPAGMTIRPSAPGDGPALHALVDRCSPGTLVRRFHGGGTGPAHREMDRVAKPTPPHRSWVAEAEGEIHGAGTLAWGRPQEERAEVAFLVEDAWFRRGVGRGLYAAMAAEARREGITVTASVQADNERAIRFLVGVAPGARPRYAGEGLVEITFPPAPAIVPQAAAQGSAPAPTPATAPRRKAA
jgi:GNAT superfamily N-acetyltransferase